MWPKYHREITERALATHLSARALAMVLRGNLGQDSPQYLFGTHPHLHFDSNTFARSYAYMDEQRAFVQKNLEQGDSASAWKALGRLTHSAQDFYAHSDYIPRWISRFDGATPPPAPEVDAVSFELLSRPGLRSGKLYYPLELLAFVRILRKYILPHLPTDSHAHMNLDGPDSSPLFPYAYHAAIKRTEIEFKAVLNQLPANLQPIFKDSNSAAI